MLKKVIKYEDFNGDPQEEAFFFHLAKNEIIDLEINYDGGIQAMLRRIMASEDPKKIVEEFKRIILLSYGEKSEDGKRFIKSEELSLAFSQMPAFDELYLELMTVEDAAANFVKGILPKDISAEVANQIGLPPPNIQPVENITKD